MPMKLISNKILREFALLHPDAGQPLQDFRYLIEKGSFANFAQLKATFASVDKGGVGLYSTLAATNTAWSPPSRFRPDWCG